MNHESLIKDSEHANQPLFLKSALDKIGAYVFAKDLDGRYTYANQKVCERFALPLAEIIGFDDSKFFSPDEFNDIKINDHIVIQQGKAVESEEKNLIANTGETRYYLTEKHPLLDSNGKITGLFGISTDITQQKINESKLQDNLNYLNNALSSTKQGWFDLNMQTGEISILGRYAETLGYSPTEFHTSFQEWQDNLHPDDRYRVLLSFDECLTQGGPMTMDYRRKAKDGDWVHFRTTAEVAEWDEHHKAVRLVGMLTDISIQKKTELNNKLRNTMLEELVNQQPLSVILESFVRSIEQQDPSSSCSILLLNHSNSRLFLGAAPSLPDFYNEAINGVEIGVGVGCCGTAACTREKVIIEDIQSHPYWEPYKELASQANIASCWSVPIIGFDNKVLGTFAIYRSEISSPTKSDIEFIESVAQLATIAIERSNAAEQLRLSSRVFNHTHEGIIITDANNRIVDVNPAFCTITGYSREEVLGKNPGLLSSGKQSPHFYDDLWQNVNSTGHWHGEVWNKNKDGEIYAELLTISTLFDEQGKAINYVGIFSDITRSKRQQDKLNLMAHYDVLTGLPNRTLFTDRFHQAIAHSKRTATHLAVCFLDLDNFKPVNDNFGHDAGDQLLLEVSKRISSCIREEDTLSRQGGDEFTLLLSDIESTEQCESMLQRILQTLAQPYLINDYQHHVTASIGVTFYPDDDNDIDTLIRHADNAMYLAKQSGKHRYKLFDSKHDQQQLQKHHRLEEIQLALNNEEFCLYYQPKVNMLSGEVIGVEALIRWNHPNNGLVAPMEFLPIIEGTELELSVGNWVINQAIKQMDEWLKQGVNQTVSINISSPHLQSQSFFSELEAALAHYPSVDSSRLELEILESSILSDLPTISNIIKTCQNTLGVTIALDDFGTGYSSLTHLRGLSADIIKIDQSFVRDMLDDPSDYTIIDGVIGLADSFGREIIAEGVETTEHGIMLILMGCQFAQGYGISRPLPADQVKAWLQNYQPNLQWVNCGNKPLTDIEKKRKLFDLTSQQWLHHFVNNIESSPADVKSWPIMGDRHGHGYQWIKRARKEHLYDELCLSRLRETHKNLHNIAAEILQYYQADKWEKARSNLSLLQSAFNEMMQVLDKK